MRKQVVTTLVLVILIGVILYFTPACKDGTITSQSPTTPGTTSGTVTTSEDTPEAATPTGTASAKVWAHGKVDVTGPWDGFICYFWLGPHEQDKAHPDVVVSVPDGVTKSYDWPGIRADNDPDHCTVQIDVGTSCAKSSIIPGMLADGYVAIKECDDCIEDPVVTVTEECSEWTECPTGDVKPEDCYRTRDCATITHTDYKCQDDTTTIADRIEKEACVCKTSCVENGPYVGEIVWDGVIREGECPAELKANCRKPCHELGEQTTTWDCEDPTTERVCRDVDCPEPEGVCYYTPDCRIGPTGACPDYMKRFMCTEEGGEWANWNGQNNQCKTDLPGIYKSNFRLVPGQSHRDCLKFTGH
jgi:hypothetical protein